MERMLVKIESFVVPRATLGISPDSSDAMRGRETGHGISNAPKHRHRSHHNGRFIVALLVAAIFAFGFCFPAWAAEDARVESEDEVVVDEAEQTALDPESEEGPTVEDDATDEDNDSDSDVDDEQLGQVDDDLPLSAEELSTEDEEDKDYDDFHSGNVPYPDELMDPEVQEKQGTPRLTVLVLDVSSSLEGEQNYISEYDSLAGRVVNARPDWRAHMT